MDVVQTTFPRRSTQVREIVIVIVIMWSKEGERKKERKSAQETYLTRAYLTQQFNSTEIKHKRERAVNI